MTDFFLLTTCLVISQYVDTNASREYAYQIYRSKHIDQRLNEIVNDNLNKELRIRSGQVLLLTRTLIDQRIVFEVKF